MARPAIQPAAVVTSVTFTQSDTVPAAPHGVRAPSRRHLAWALPLVVIGFLGLGAVIFAAVAPSKWFVEKPKCLERSEDGTCAREEQVAVEFALVPADAEPVEPRLRIDGTETYDSAGQIYFVTIREPRITLLDWLVTKGSPTVRYLSYTDKYGDKTEEQLLQTGQRQMTGAKDRATYVAFERAGFDVARKNGPAVVDYVLCLQPNENRTKCERFAPAHDVLQPLDTITAINGTPIVTVDDIGPVLKGVTAGDTVEVTVERDGKPLTVDVETILAPGEDTPRTIIGFSPVDTTTVELPDGVSVDIATEGIGGPSAGVAFTLTLIDAITPGNLMGDQKIAVTGEIDIDGNVGAIGGLNSKASAVKQVGVKYFLVPAGQPDDPKSNDSIAAARRVVGDSVTIIPIATIDDALRVLQELGGDPLPAK